MADVETEAAITLAVRFGALAQCATCEGTWNSGEVDPDDDDALDELAAQAYKVTDPELAVFDSEASLKEALGRVIGDAPSEQDCPH
jgi:hypothetical protein